MSTTCNAINIMIHKNFANVLVRPREYWKCWLISSPWSQQIFLEVNLSPTFEATQKQNDEIHYEYLAQSLWGHRIIHWQALYCNAIHCLPLAKAHRRGRLSQHHIDKSPTTFFSRVQENLFGFMHGLSSIYTFYSYNLLLHVPLSLVAGEIISDILPLTYVCKSLGGPFVPKVVTYRAP